MDQLLSEKERISSNINDVNFKLSFPKIHDCFNYFKLFTCLPVVYIP